MFCLCTTTRIQRAGTVRSLTDLGDRPEAEVHDVLAVGHAPIAHLQHVRICTRQTTGPEVKARIHLIMYRPLN
jgi:hypothetical protein